MKNSVFPEKELEIILFKFGLINEIINGKDYRGKTVKIIAELCSKEFKLPGTEKTKKISQATIYRYLKKYREQGIEGFKNKDRITNGKFKAFSKEILDFAIKLRKEISTRSTIVLIEILNNEFGNIKIAPSTLNYHLRKLGYSKQQLGVTDKGTFGRFESKAANILWIGDYHDKNNLLLNGREVHIVAFIDCKTRHVVHAEYYYGENLMTLEDCFKKATLKSGCPKNVFLDNAKIFHSKRFAYCCLKLGINPPIFSTAYIPESRGKIEIFFKYIKYSFETEVIARGGCKDMEELNQLLVAFLELKYNYRVHSETKAVPKIEFEKEENKNYPDINILNELFMIPDKRSVHKKTKTVAVMNKLFLTDGWLGGKKVEVHYNPNDLSYVLIYYNEKFIMKAMPFEINKKGKKENPQPEENNFKYDYLAALKGKYDRMLKENATLATFGNIKTDDTRPFIFSDFIKIMVEMLNKKFSDYEKTNLKNFFETYRPENGKIIVEAVVYAIDKYKDSMHLNVYLDVIKLFLLAKRSEMK